MLAAHCANAVELQHSVQHWQCSHCKQQLPQASGKWTWGVSVSNEGNSLRSPACNFLLITLKCAITFETISRDIEATDLDLIHLLCHGFCDLKC